MIRHSKAQEGFSLIEVMIAVVVVTVALVALLGSLGVA
jgi:prepilin-type N-terminal cleavage/methylation domain-containing protein